MVVGGECRVQRFELVLREEADPELRRASHLACIRREALRHELGEGGLAVAVLAEESDAVVVVDAKVEVREHRMARRIADRHAFHADDRRRERLLRIGEAKRDRVLLRDLGDRLESGDGLQA